MMQGLVTLFACPADATIADAASMAAVNKSTIELKTADAFHVSILLLIC
jgi:hypothetical protein